MICKICYDAKRNGYNTHWTKDTSGNILCPYLINLKCQRCKYTGHTQKYCKISDQQLNSIFNLDKKIKIIKELPKKITNIFNLLCEDEDEDEDKNVSVIITITDEEYFTSPIIWGKGREIMLNVRWVDVV